MQTTAARLVERQVVGRRNVAQMFGHVGRRTQNLVGRQLALIDNLERRETDSDRLRELYRLDHMSSRLRRNASSLVVLSGGAGTNEHMAPLSLSDVVRLALGEIEDYTRVDVEVPEEILVVPSVVADLTLLLAELMENATSFSPPHAQVTVTAAELRGGARLAVVDHGLGLPPERLAEENARLTRRERLDLAPTEVLGLFVVGRLARRHGIEVTLDRHPGRRRDRVDRPAPGAPGLAGRDGAGRVPGRSRPPSAASTASSPRCWPAPRPGRRRAAPSRSTPTCSTGPPAPCSRPAPGTRSCRSAPARPSWRPDRAATRSSPARGRSRSRCRPYASPAYPQAPAYQSYEAPVYDAEPMPMPDQRHPYDAGTPVAGRHPAAMPELPVAHPTTGRYADTEAPVVMEGPIVTSGPAEAIQLPRQRTGDDPRNGDQRNGGQSPLRRRVPGNQLPVETGPKVAAVAPSTDDALAARDAFEAFEAGVSRAQWDVIEADMASPPAAGHPPLARRVPGASLPVSEPMNPKPPASPTQPLDPDAARALVEQFEYGVALALNETQPLHEGQPR